MSEIETNTGNDVENQLYKQKCRDLKRRIAEVEDNNELATLALTRTRLAVRRLRLEYAMLLERLEERVVLPEESEDDDHNEANGLTVVAPKRTGLSPGAKKGKRGGSKTSSRIRDPDHPKRPTNAYLIFCDLEKESVRNDLQTKNPGVAIDLSKGLIEAWKQLDEEARKPYFKLYEEDRDRYVKQVEVYKRESSAESSNVAKKQKVGGVDKSEIDVIMTEVEPPKVETRETRETRETQETSTEIEGSEVAKEAIKEVSNEVADADKEATEELIEPVQTVESVEPIEPIVESPEKDEI